jgi:hypothetical protein
MPYKRGEGTFIIDRRFGGVGRVRGPSGTQDEDTFDRIKALLTELYERGRLDLLRAIKQYFTTHGRAGLAPMVVYAASRDVGILQIPAPDGLAPLVESMLDFVETHDVTDAHKATMRSCVRHIARVGHARSPVSDLPEFVGQLRLSMRDHARMFNLVRSTAMAFVRSRFKKHHPLWNDIAGIDPLTSKKKRLHFPKTPDELRDITCRMEPEAAAMAWSMAAAGMGPKEYWVDGWEVQPDRIRIFGAKRDARDRFVPLIKGVTLVRPTITLKAFRLALANADYGRMGVYDLRRSHSNWMESAGIPRTRRRIYRGHGPQDVGDLYEHHEIAQFIADDSLKLSRYVVPEANVALIHEPKPSRFELVS